MPALTPHLYPVTVEGMTRQWRAIVTREESIETKLHRSSRAAIRWADKQMESVCDGDETVHVTIRPMHRHVIKLQGWDTGAA